DDNPKEGLSHATFCNLGFQEWLASHGVAPDSIWRDGDERTLWNARLFPACDAAEGFRYAAWLLDMALAQDAETAALRDRWLNAERLSMASLHPCVDVETMLARRERHTAQLVE